MPTRSHARRRAWIAGTTAVGLALAAGLLAPPWGGAARVLVGTIGDRSQLPAPLAEPPHAVVEADERLAGLRVRRYAPEGVRQQHHVVLLPGAHPRGIDEPRLRQMARALAAEGLTVHAAELPTLRALQLSPEVVEHVAAVLVAASRRAGGARVTAFGISVTGGFLLQAALRADVASALACAVAVGAHHDLREVARAYARRAGTTGPGALDPYGARLLVAANADALFAAADVVAARQAIHLHVRERYAEARAALGRLTPEGRTLVVPLLREPSAVVPRLMATLLERRSDALLALSPAGKLGALRVPTFLLHGEQDPVVPSSETRALAEELRGASEPPRVLITPLLRHAEGNGAMAAADSLRLIDFMADVLGATERRARR